MSSLVSKFWNKLGTRRVQARARRPAINKNKAHLSVEAFEERMVPTVVFRPAFGNESPIAGSQNIGMKSPPVYLVYWGNYWTTQQGQQDMSNMTTAAQSILGGTYLTGLTQYGSDGKATFGGSILDGSAANGNPSTTQLQTYLQGLIDGGQLPSPGTLDATAGPIYVVITDPNVSSTNGGYNVQGSYNLSLPFFQLTEPMHMVFVGTSLNNGSVVMDYFTETFSHEIAETISDPTSGTGAEFNPPNSLPSSLLSPGGNQIGDFEPEQNGGIHYSYRLNGYEVQPYWSARDSAFIVPDGNRQNFYLDPIWDANNNFTGQYKLALQGDQLGANYGDQITIDRYSNNSGQSYGVKATMNGETAQFDPGAIQTINVDTRGGYNYVNVAGLPSGVTLNVDSLGQSSDTVVVGNNGSLAGIQGTVNVSNTSGQTALYVEDYADPTARNISVNNNSVVFDGLATINYQGAAQNGFGNVTGVTALDIYDGTAASTIVANSINPMTTTMLIGNWNDYVYGPAVNQLIVTS